MTVVAAAAGADGLLVFAADSLTVAHEGNRAWPSMAKVLRKQCKRSSSTGASAPEEVLLATSGSSVLRDLADYALELPGPPARSGSLRGERTRTPEQEAELEAAYDRRLDEWAWKVGHALDALALTRGLTVDGNAALADAWAMLGFDGRLWHVGTGQALRMLRGFDAIGSGADLAVGAMHALRERGEKHPAELVAAGVRAAVEHDASCGGPDLRLEALPPARKRLG